MGCRWRSGEGRGAGAGTAGAGSGEAGGEGAEGGEEVEVGEGGAGAAGEGAGEGMAGAGAGEAASTLRGGTGEGTSLSENSALVSITNFQGTREPPSAPLAVFRVIEYTHLHQKHAHE